MNKKMLITTVTLIITSIAFAQHGNHDSKQAHRGQRDYGQGMIERLELTTEQQEDFEKLSISHHQKMQPIKNALDEKRAALKTQVTADKVDQKKVAVLIADISELQKEALTAKTTHQITLRALLTDSQKVKFDRGLERRGSRFDHRRG